MYFFLLAFCVPFIPWVAQVRLTMQEAPKSSCRWHLLVPPALLHTCRGAKPPPGCVPHQGGSPPVSLRLCQAHAPWHSGFLLFLHNDLFWLHSNAKTFSKVMSQTIRLTSQSFFPQNTRLLKDTGDRQCLGHPSFCSSLTCRNKWLRWIFTLNGAACGFNSFSGVCICFFSGKGIYLQSKLYFFRDLLCPRKQRRKNLR